MGAPDLELEQLIRLTEAGKADAREKLFAVLYAELHNIAQRALRRNSSVTLSPTTLLHETYLNMSGRESAPFSDRAHFLAYASRAMRGLIINYVREKSAQKRGGAFEITVLPTELPETPASDLELEKIGEAVESLGAFDPRLARLVDLKFFCGFTFEEIAGVMGISERTAKRDWDKARIILQQYLEDGLLGED
jgi:RNA polymerase sigma factor (TIGR02999 family)